MRKALGSLANGAREWWMGLFGGGGGGEASTPFLTPGKARSDHPEDAASDTVTPKRSKKKKKKEIERALARGK